MEWADEGPSVDFRLKQRNLLDGVYELDKQRVFGKIVKPGQVFFDLGANGGFYTLLGSLLVGNGGRVIAFEPASRNVSYLRRHLAINRIANCEVLEAAVSSKDGTALFDVAHLPVSGHISHRATESGYQVVTVAIDRLVHEGAIPARTSSNAILRGASMMRFSARATL